MTDSLMVEMMDWYERHGNQILHKFETAEHHLAAYMLWISVIT